MNANVGTSSVRLCAILLCGLCLIALIPASLLAYVGGLWLWDLEWPAKLSAAAMFAGPLPLALGAFFAWKAAQARDRENLAAGAVAVIVALTLYVVAWAWGGRMLV